MGQGEIKIISIVLYYSSVSRDKNSIIMAKVLISTKVMATFLILMAIVLAIEGDQPDLNGLLIGKLISQGSVRSDILGDAARSLGVKSNQVEEVKGNEVAESARQHIQPEENLEIGSLIEEFKAMPSDRQVQKDIGSAMLEKVQGKILDENVQTGHYVPNPVMTLTGLKQKGEVIETVTGEIVAGDAGDLNVIRIKQTELEDGPNAVENRQWCGRSCSEDKHCQNLPKLHLCFLDIKCCRVPNELACTDNEYACKNGWQCVWKVDVCDGFPSCENGGDDEVGCDCRNRKDWCELAKPDCSTDYTKENCQKYCGLCDDIQ